MMSLRPITGKIYDRRGASYVIYPAIILFSLGLVILSQIQSLTGLLVAKYALAWALVLHSLVYKL